MMNRKSMEVEQDHMVMSRRYEGQKGDACHGCMVVSWRKDTRESSRMKNFLFYCFLIESPTFVIFLRVEIERGAYLALAVREPLTHDSGAHCLPT